MKLLSRGNKKLPSSTAIFNLPAGRTCPNSTAQCRKFCYARKAERIYPAVLPFRMRNWDLTKQETFVALVSSELSRARTITTVRIHESGDFYSEDYFKKWIRIAEAHPNLIFYAYTKVPRLGVFTRPKNFILLLSDDNKTFKNLWHQFSGAATVTLRKQQPDKNWFVCPGSCKTCDYCYNDTVDKRVTFEEH